MSKANGSNVSDNLDLKPTTETETAAHTTVRINRGTPVSTAIECAKDDMSCHKASNVMIKAARVKNPANRLALKAENKGLKVFGIASALIQTR